MKWLNQIYSRSMDVARWPLATWPRVAVTATLGAVVAFETFGPWPGLLREPNLAHLKARFRVLRRLPHGLALLLQNGGLWLSGRHEGATQISLDLALWRQVAANVSDLYGYRATGAHGRISASMNMICSAATAEDYNAVLKAGIDFLRTLGAAEGKLKTIASYPLEKFRSGLCFGMCVEVARQFACGMSLEQVCRSFEHGADKKAMAFQAYYFPSDIESEEFVKAQNNLIANRETNPNFDLEFRELHGTHYSPAFELCGLKLNCNVAYVGDSPGKMVEIWRDRLDSLTKNNVQGLDLMVMDGPDGKAHACLCFYLKDKSLVIFDPNHGAFTPHFDRWLTACYAMLNCGDQDCSLYIYRIYRPNQLP